jgi:hypothetical protein
MKKFPGGFDSRLGLCAGTQRSSVLVPSLDAQFARDSLATSSLPVTQIRYHGFLISQRN